MEEYTHIVSLLALTLGTAWASGINLYATILTLGLLITFGQADLPPGLEILGHPVVIIAAGIMFIIECVADKIPGVDSGWDAIHTFIRIPAGAILAAAALGDVSTPLSFAAALIGGSLAATSHATKAGTRALINTSPEPVSNWTASLIEDAAVIGGLWAALYHPWIFLLLLLLFILLAIYLLPKIWRGIRAIWRKIVALFQTKEEDL
jgi:hypothetical protein